MSVSWLCFNCVPEGTRLGFSDLTTGTPQHCNGRNDTTRPGLLGGYRCSCECNQTTAPDDRRCPLLEYLDELDALYGPPSPELVEEMEKIWQVATKDKSPDA